tara:strand:- start:846 stop:1379 length:534 start_codon:yes stop_codon:yes gene_type:complete
MACQDYTDSAAGTSDAGLSTTSYPLGLGAKISASHPLVGYTLNSVTCTIKISSSVTGNPDLTCYHFDGEGDPATLSDYRAISDSHASSEFVGAFTEKKFTFSSPAVLQAGDYIAVMLPSGQSGLSFFTETNSYTTNTNFAEWRVSWSDKTTGFTFTAEYDCDADGATTLLPPPVAWI